MSSEDFSTNVCQYFRPKTLNGSPAKTVNGSPIKTSRRSPFKTLRSTPVKTLNGSPVKSMSRSPVKTPKTSPNKSNANPKANPKTSAFDSRRNHLLMKLMSKFDDKMTRVRDRMFEPLMQSLFTFVSQNCLTNQMRETSFETKLTANVGLIPTALLSIGMNSSEHKFICDLLMETIQDLTSVVVYLNRSQNAKDMSLIFKAISDSILTTEVIESADLDEHQIKRMTFGSLFRIYEENVLAINTNNFCPPIVLFLDEIESFDHSLVTTLILILKEYMQTIPFILIMSKSNETTSLQHLLPSSATDYLLVNNFQSVSGHQVVDEIITELFIQSDIRFKLGPNVLDFMLKMFEKFDFSIQNIQHIIKYSLFSHFYSNHLSFICQSESNLKKYIKRIESKEMKLLRDSKLFDSQLSDSEIKKCVTHEVSKLMSIHNQFVDNLKLVLRIIDGNIDICNESLVHLYVNALNASYDFSPIIDVLSKLSQSQWTYSLEMCLSDNSVNSETPQPLIKTLITRRKLLMGLVDESPPKPQVVVEKAEVLELKDKLAKLKTRSQWKETIKPLNKPKMLSKFDVWRDETIASIGQILNATTHPMSRPMSQVIFFDAIDSVKQRLFVDQRSDTQKSLSTPLTDAKRSETDFHILHYIYNDSQAVVNMYDWFQTFVELITPLTTSPAKKSKTDSKSDENIVRFLNAVSDFEYMGLLESSKRKTDHLNRLVWF